VTLRSHGPARTEKPKENRLAAPHGKKKQTTQRLSVHGLQRGKDLTRKESGGEVMRKTEVLACRDQPSALAVGFCWDRPSVFAGIDRQLLPLVFAGIDRRLLLGSTTSCKVSSANGNCTRRFDAAEQHTFSVFLIAI
jgi:hypothetical protein